MTTLHRDTTDDDATVHELWMIESQFWEAGSAIYADAFATDGLAVVPGAILSQPQLVDLMQGTTPWADVEVKEDRVVTLGDDAVALVYHARARRDERREAIDVGVTSVYRRDGDDWQLTVHQQTVMVDDPPT